MKKYFLILTIALFILSCSSSDPSSPAQHTISEGNWVGTTVEGDTITFTVSQSQVNNFQLTIIIEFNNLTDTVVWNPANMTITDNSFSINDSITGNPSYTLSIDGNFNPPTSVSGMFGIDGIYHPDSSSTQEINDSLSWNASFNN